MTGVFRALPAILVLSSTALLAPGGALAWTADTRIAMADYARRTAPPDLARQLERHKVVYQEGAGAPLDASAGYDEIAASVMARIERGIEMIEEHRPFVELAGELGRLARELAELNDPLKAIAEDPYEDLYAGDWELYVDSAQPRFSVLLYGDGRNLAGSDDILLLLERTGRRAEELYPLVSREYRRIPAADGRLHFDDQSTAFGTAALAFSHGVSDLVAVLRYIWLRAGGIDERDYLTYDADRAVLLPPGP